MCAPHRDLLDGLRKRGFMLNDGPLGTGARLLVWTRAGGLYLGVFAAPNNLYRFIANAVIL
jgi:hypothetical protein